MDDTQDFKSLQDTIQAALIASTRTSGYIASEDLPFQRSLNPEVATALDEQSARLLTLSSALLKSAASLADLTVPELEDVDDVDNNWRGVVDIVDSLLEKSDTCLDEYSGLIKRREDPNIPNIESPSKSRSTKHTSSLGNSFRTQNLVKPQLAFEVKPDNDDTSVWKPLLTTKPHALVPLEESLGTFTNEYDQKQYDYTVFLPLLAIRPEGLSKSQRKNHRERMAKLRRKGSTIKQSNNLFRYRHPYETEILQLKYPESVYQKTDPIDYLPIEMTSATFVDTLEGVLEMLEELKTATEIAVDLEHHDARSYVGLVSLMQISTRNRDWIVDTLKPWRYKLEVLNEVFADPNIIKVFHGAYMDIVWLQRDLGLYIVGLFDTHWASRTLGYQGGSLAFLLKKFINFDADKKYQLADWRIRPLPDEMFFYARADTHYLLYIYDNMRNELIDRTNPDIPEENRIEAVLQKSKETSLKRFERQVYYEDTGKGPGGWYQLLVKTPALFNNQQFSVFRAVHAWRDKIARIDDDSTAFVMPNQVIFTIAKLMPMDMVALLGIAFPISHGVKSRSGELLELIKSAKVRGNEGPSMMDVLRPDTVGAIAKANLPSVSAKAVPKTLVAVVNEDELRSEQSSFWGGAFGSSIWDAPAPENHDEHLRLALPFPALSSETFASSAALNGLTDRSKVQTGQATPIQSPQTGPPEKKASDEAFTIKRGSNKRKSDARSSDEGEDEEDESGEGEETSEYDISFSDAPMTEEEIEGRRKLKQIKRERNEHHKEKKRLKNAAKNAKKQKKLERGQTQVQAVGSEALHEEDADDEPFDYSKAESVLHGKHNPGDQTGSKKNKQPFDPYAKSADAPKGMRRLQTERPGKSHTFKG